MDVVTVMAAYADPFVLVCTTHMHNMSEYAARPIVLVCSTHTHHGLEYAAITPTISMSTDMIEPFL